MGRRPGHARTGGETVKGANIGSGRIGPARRPHPSSLRAGFPYTYPVPGPHEPRAAMPLTIVIFGASGDLTSRKLAPALFQASLKGRLPAGTRVVGVSRSPLSNDQFRDH